MNGPRGTALLALVALIAGELGLLLHSLTPSPFFGLGGAALILLAFGLGVRWLLELVDLNAARRDGD